MRIHAGLAISCAVLAACAARQTAWTAVDPPDLADGGEAFVLVDHAALHLANVEQSEGHLEGRIVHAWALPRAGVVAVADDSTTTSPEEIAHRAGWPELTVANRRVFLPVSAIRSARGVVDVEPDPEQEASAGSSGPPLAIAFLEALIDVALEPRCCRRCR